MTERFFALNNKGNNLHCAFKNAYTVNLSNMLKYIFLNNLFIQNKIR